MMLGLGIYLPFYMSLTAFLGAMAKVAYDAVCKLRRKGLSPEAAAEKEKAQGETGPRGVVRPAGRRIHRRRPGGARRRGDGPGSVNAA